MAFLNDFQVAELGLKSVGKNVQISDKCSLYDASKISIGSNVRIDDFVILSGNVSLGSYIHISAHASIISPRAKIQVDDFSTISLHCSILSSNDSYDGSAMTNPTIPRHLTGVTDEDVDIKKHVILGSYSLVLPGSVLSEGSSFGAYSFVDGFITESWSIYVGIPCRKIGERKRVPIELSKNISN